MPTALIEKAREICDATVTDLNDISFSESFTGQFRRLLWASDRIDRRAELARAFWHSSQEVIALRVAGPSSVYMHDPVKENLLAQEYDNQKAEGVEKFSYGPGADFVNILQAMDWAEKLSGDLVEIGCFNGSSTSVMAAYMESQRSSKTLFVYDTFDGFSYKEAFESKDFQWAGTHSSEGFEEVAARVKARAPVKSDQILVFKRNILDPSAIEEVNQISFASIDVDLYEAVLRGLELVHEKILIGGIVLVEDPGHLPPFLGAKIALEEFLDSVPSDTYLKFMLESGQYMLVRMGFSL